MAEKESSINSSTIIFIIFILILIAVIVFSIYSISQNSILKKEPACKTPGAFRDITLNQCFICPPGMDRTLDSITNTRGCQGLCPDIYPNRPNPTGSFEDGLTGICYHCPGGMGRTAAPISENNACLGSCPNIYKPTNAGPEGSFQDGLTGICWHCPSGFVRTVGADPINGPQACTTPFGASRFRQTRAIRDGPDKSAGTKDGPRFSPGIPVD